MAPRGNGSIVLTAYPDHCLPIGLQNRNIRDRVTLEDGRVEFERRTMELSGLGANLAQLYATYPIQRPWENQHDTITRLLFEFADLYDLDSIEGTAEILVGLVELAKSHEWCLDSPSPRTNDGSSWRIRAEFAATCRPKAPIGHRDLFSATYRKCYDVREDSFTHCCANRCSRKVTRKRANRRCWRGTVELDEKCKFCFAREHSARCEANLACRCACLAYNYDMMWTPIGEGTFEYSNAYNRTASYVDSTNGCLIMPRDIVDVLVNMGFATVGVSARDTESVADIDAAAAAAAAADDVEKEDTDDDVEKEDTDDDVEKEDTDDDVEKEDTDDDGHTLFLVNGSGAVQPLFAGKYVNVMIRCCACLFTVSLSDIVDWEKLNHSHGAYCPPCAFVRTPPLAESVHVVAYRQKFAFVHALSYSACTWCACNYIAPSSFK